MASPLDGLTKLLGSDVVKQILIWQVMGQIFAPILAPVVAELEKGVWSAAVEGSNGAVSIPLSPADLVDIAIKSHLKPETAAGLAAQSGVSPEQFKLLLESAGEPLGPQELLAAFRRAIIPEDADPTLPSLRQGIRESRINNKWITVLEALQWQPLTVGDAVDAWVESQISPEEAKTRLRVQGIKEEEATILFNTRGRPPSPSELLEMANRGLIPVEGTGPDVLSVQQGIFEGATKNKWWQALAQLRLYHPPPRTIVALLRAGAIPDELGLTLLKQAGLTDELATAYIKEAHQSKTATTRELTATNIATLYAAKAMTEAEAIAALEKIGYTPTDAALELELASAKVAQSQLTSATNRVRALYIGHHIEKADAIKTLGELGLPGDQVTHLVATWELERGLNVHTLTASELATAAFYGIISDQEAVDRMTHLGYGPRDAWIMLGNRKHAKPGIPEPTSNVPPA